jgi:two-component system NtrC family sensor kinase
VYAAPRPERFILFKTRMRLSFADRQKAGEIAPPPVDRETHGTRYFAQLRTRLRWQLLVAYVTPLVLLSVVFHYQYDKTLRSGIETHLKSVAENKRNTVSLFLQERVANLKGVFQVRTPWTAPTSSALEKTLEVLQKESAAYVDLGLFGPDGKLVSYTGPFTDLLGRNYSSQSWFQRLAAQESDFTISDVYRGFRDRPHFIVAVRKSVEGKGWILRASVDPEKFSEFVERSILMRRAEAFIVNREGTLQTKARGDRIGRVVLEVPKSGLDTTVQEEAFGGENYLTAYSWLGEADWALVVRVPASIAYEPIRKARMIFAGILVPVLGLTFVFVVVSTRRIVRRLEAADRSKEELKGQLFNAAKLASVGEMAAGVAHEINNPLAIIYEEAGLMKDSVDPQFGGEFKLDEFRESLDAIMEASLRGRSITGKLLAFARKNEEDPEPTDINRLLEAVLSIKERELQLSNIELRRDLGQELPRVLVNPNQMEQVVLNLLNNAKDAIQGSGHIGVKTSLQNGRVHLAVQDSGCGMTDEQMEKIFFPFFTTKAVGKGTGLGLSISYGIVKAFGGNIEVTSAPGKGTTFYVILPAVQHRAKGGRVVGAEGIGNESRAEHSGG